MMVAANRGVLGIFAMIGGIRHPCSKALSRDRMKCNFGSASINCLRLQMSKLLEQGVKQLYDY
jgi:hypothetical protein